VAEKLPANTDYRVSIVNSPAPDAYPIASFTWILAYRTQTHPEKGRKLVDFLRWALQHGRQSAAALDYAPLPQRMIPGLMQRLDSIRVAGPAT
jgi:phosphate transport system substrate-binding protein